MINYDLKCNICGAMDSCDENMIKQKLERPCIECGGGQMKVIKATYERSGDA